MKPKICIVSSSALPIPAVKGGAVESLVNLLCEDNEIEKKLDITVITADISWFFIGLEQFSYIVVRNTIVKVACIAFLFVFIKSKDDLYLYIFLMTMANFLGTLSMWMYIPKMVKKVK